MRVKLSDKAVGRIAKRIKSQEESVSEYDESVNEIRNITYDNQSIHRSVRVDNIQGADEMLEEVDMIDDQRKSLMTRRLELVEAIEALRDVV